MLSAAEAELGAMFIHAREAVPCKKTLQEMGHQQPRTHMQIDNSTAVGVANKTIKPRRTKAMDMRLHWLRSRSPKAVQVLLATRKVKFGGLLDETPLRHAPQGNETQFFNATRRTIGVEGVIQKKASHKLGV